MTECDRLTYLLMLDLMTLAELDLAFGDITYYLHTLDQECDIYLEWEVTSP